MNRLIGAVLVLFVLLACASLAAAESRALLIGCDRFLSQQDTWPSSWRNVERMADALSGGADRMETVITRPGGLGNAEELNALIQDAFGPACDEDVSYFYISTHGIWKEGQPAAEAVFLLSDGQNEEGLRAGRLREMLDTVRGTKVIILDACHAGAVIGKGVPAPFDSVFRGSGYQVLASSGGAEESWFWSGGEDGAGYFSGALASCISANGAYAADLNRDGLITMREIRTCLRLRHGESTVQIYPEEGSFVFLRCGTARRPSAALTGISFETGAVSPADPTVAFSFTVQRPVSVGYRLVGQSGGYWDFADADFFYDSAEPLGIYGDKPGYLTPGYKERELTLDLSDGVGYGYMLLQILLMEDSGASVAASAVLCVPPLSGDPALSVECPDEIPSGEEMTFSVLHVYPCEMTVTVHDGEGRMIRRIASRQATRPEQMSREATTLTWDGRTESGDPAPQGQYTIHVKAWVGAELWECDSQAFCLADSEERSGLD